MLSSMEKVIGDDNLLEEILLRLPAEIVYGFIPVSKRWCSLITSVPFRRRHRSCHLHLPNNMILMLNQRKASTTSLLKVRNGTTIIKISNIESDKLLSSVKPFYEKLLKKVDESKKIEFKIHDVNNGLFLFSLRIRDRASFLSFINGGEVYYLVCNPLTKEYLEVPISNDQMSSPFTEVAFAPSTPYGHNKGIVVFFDQDYDGYTVYNVKVFSSETRTWKTSSHMGYYSLSDSKSIVWDNCLLLFPLGKWSGPVRVLDSERLGGPSSSLLVPTLAETSSSLLPTCGKYSNFPLIDYYGESGGFVYVVECIECVSEEKNQYKLWEMEGVAGSWKEKFQFRNVKDSKTLYIHREGDNKVWLLLSESSKVYYCLSGNIESLADAGDLANIYWNWNIRSYTPSLFPLGG